MLHVRGPIVSCLAALLFAATVHAALGGAAGVVIPYAGRLELDGALVTGTVNFRFGIMNGPTTQCLLAGTPAVIVVANVPVTNGEFALSISGVPEVCVKGTDVHLNIEIQQGAGAFVALGQQRVTPLLSAVTSGAGDFAVAGELSAASATITGGLTAATTSAGALTASSANVSGGLNAGTASINGLTAQNATVSGLLTVGYERKECLSNLGTLEISGTIGVCRCNGSGFVISGNALCQNAATDQLAPTTFSTGSNFIVTGRLCPAPQVTRLELICARLR